MVAKNSDWINHSAIAAMLRSTQRGIVYLWALYTVALAGILMAAAAQVWQAKSQREKEAELLFIGEQFRLAIKSYQSTGTKQFPKTLEDLVEDKRTPTAARHLRKIYVDPITNSTEWGLVYETPPNAQKGAAASSNTSTNNANNNTSNTPKDQSSTLGGTGSVSGASNPGTGVGSQGASIANTSSGTASSTTSTTSNQTSNNASSSSGSGKSTGSNLGSALEKRITGVYSLSERKPLKRSQFPEHFKKFSEAVTYQDWQFVYKGADGKAAGAAGQGGAAPKPAAGAGNASSASPFGAAASSGKTQAPASPFGQPSGNPNSDSSGGFGFPSGK